MDIVLASGNLGKIREFARILQTISLTLRSMSDLGIPEPEETGLTFKDNALLKARAASRHSNLPAIADDSGLSVDGLHGAPGVYSARYAGPNATDQQNIEKLLSQLDKIGNPSRIARFHCVIALVRHGEDEHPLLFCGSWEGQIALAPAGSHGFGYDPVFYIPEYGCTSAELAPEIKNKVSHRAKALDQFKTTLRQTDCLMSVSNQSTSAVS